ncbi:MAG: sugar transferase [Ruminococcus sp.]|jgi:lipopolysaccharide/colanic/teichoic acid biosynthesis glycosyltransferase|nr:sugar transferase [Ruminococcus sp.]
MKLNSKQWYKLPEWDDLPKFMRNDEIKLYYNVLKKRKVSLYLKRAFDFSVAAVMLTVLSIPMAVIAVGIKLDTPGPVFYKQERITTYGRKFRIHKFRTMVDNAEKLGTSVTVNNDKRITKMGQRLRDLRLDELPQLIDVLQGNMSFVGTRPEAVKYVKQYTSEMFATLLLPAGITSEACIRYKEEYKLLDAADDVDKVYVEEVLPAKMVWNLESVRRFRFLREILTMFRTVFAVLGKDYN